MTGSSPASPREHVTIGMGVPACSVDGDVRVNLEKYGMIVDADEAAEAAAWRSTCSEDGGVSSTRVVAFWVVNGGI